jgi:hypothetical protein
MTEGMAVADGLGTVPDQKGQVKLADGSRPGPWSRFRALRIIAWVVMVPIVLALALYCSARLSGFTSVLEMVDWFRVSFNI